MSFSKVTIIGIGLMGGSIAKALRKAKYNTEIIASGSSEATLRIAKEENIIDNYSTDIAVSVKNSDLIIIAAPLIHYSKIIDSIKGSVKDSAIISEIGSVKSYVESLFVKQLPHTNLKNTVLTHPIAGSEQTGIAASNADLFNNKRLIITPIQNITTDDSIKRVANLWQNIGSFIDTKKASEHDEIYARVSHLPQLIAFALNREFNELYLCDENCMARFTRLTKSKKELWQDIFNFNKQHLKEALNCFIEQFKIISQDTDLAHKYIISALNKRSKIFREENTTEKSSIMPTLIAAAVININDSLEYAGTGLRDLTYPIACKYNLKQINSEEFTNEKNILINNLKEYFDNNIK